MPAHATHHLFIVGPASVGKSTVGKELANRLKVNFIDVDLEFNIRIEDITKHINTKGYESYAKTNSTLVATLIAENGRPCVFALPAGFLVHESVPGLALKNLSLMKRNGLIILLLPSKSAAEAVELIVKRQLARWDDMTAEGEYERFMRRFEIYIQHGDIQVFSSEHPQIIAQKIILELEELHPDWFNLLN